MDVVQQPKYSRALRNDSSSPRTTQVQVLHDFAMIAKEGIIRLRSTTSEFKLRNLDPVGIDWTPFKILPPQTTCCSASSSMLDSTMQHGRIRQCLSLRCASFAGSARKLWPWPNASSAEYSADVYGSVPTDVALKECSAVPCCQTVYS